MSETNRCSAGKNTARMTAVEKGKETETVGRTRFESDNLLTG